MTKLEALLNRGIQPLLDWIDSEAQKQPALRFQANTSLANPLSLYLSAHLGGKRVAIYGWTVEYQGKHVQLPPDLGRFLLRFNRVFGNTKPTAEEVKAWLIRTKMRVFASYEIALAAAQERQRAQRRRSDFGIVRFSSTTQMRYRIYPFDICSQNGLRGCAVDETAHLVARLARTGLVQVFAPPRSLTAETVEAAGSQ